MIIDMQVTTQKFNHVVLVVETYNAMWAFICFGGSAPKNIQKL
jgi:hypothetical protein